ncbi:TolB family protein [Evansella tamaricis]|uniref:Uncharacterized protein n=1 Tax=Evansella tamaricis TaxID=2069301 RepID=A0ABS6JES5_9BACI|nr:hypothetical protein [Evansella tamaricis]MBU9712180.1 hypothetical protein [Evansella tamaricis]
MKKKRTIVFVSIVSLVGFLLIVFGAWHEMQPHGKTGLGDTVSISPDDKKIVFHYYEYGISSIYTANMDGTNVQKLSHTSGDSHIQPVFSNDGTKIIFISLHEEEMNSSIMMMNADGTNVKTLTSGEELITEAIFSPDDTSIFFLQAGVYQNYSPIARKAPHDFDIYSIDIDGNNKQQLTFREEYHMGSLGILNDGKHLIFETYDNNQTAFFMSLEDPMNVHAFNPILESSAPIADVYYVTPSPDGKKLAFSTVANTSDTGTFLYETFVMDTETEIAKQVTRFGQHSSSPMFFNDANRLLVVRDIGWPKSTQNEYWVIQLDTLDAEKIEMEIK